MPIAYRATKGERRTFVSGVISSARASSKPGINDVFLPPDWSIGREHVASGGSEVSFIVRASLLALNESIHDDARHSPAIPTANAAAAGRRINRAAEDAGMQKLPNRICRDKRTNDFIRVFKT